ncbi:MAG: hypothetical protein O3A84_03535 [Proteobacteria bacterium]|nr:hypothetical protein [Pseudomonadota bacterium]
MVDRDRKKYEDRMAGGPGLTWAEDWRPPKTLKIKDVFPHLTINDQGTMFVQGFVVTNQVIRKHWPFFRDMIDKDDLPRVYQRYKKAIDARQDPATR